MVIAGFFKHNFPMIPAVALIWLAFIDKRAALRATIFGALLCIIGVLLCIMAFGPNFLNEMMMPREITFNHILSAANRLQWIAPAVAAWGLWAWPNRRQPAAQFTALLIVMTLFNGLYTAAGAGVTYNAYLAVTFATAIAIGVAIERIDATKIWRRLTPSAVKIIIVSLLLLRVVLWPRYEYYLVLASPSFREEYRQDSIVLNNEIARIRAIQGPVACEPLIICYRAGKAFVYERYWVEQLIATGRWTKDAIDKGVRERGIRFEMGNPSVGFPKKLLF
jgi:drug/metabolite transporter superfamily protein YnfA